MEDLYISPEGGAIRDVLQQLYNADGTVPCQIDGEFKCSAIRWGVQSG